MGALQSRLVDFQAYYAIYQACIDSIKTEHPIQVYNKLMKEKFKLKKQIEAVVIIIYEKAVLHTNLSLKCAQLVKELESEGLFENDEKIMFHVAFDQYLMKLVHSIIDNYDDSKMTEYAVQRGKSIAFFIGNLFVVDALAMTLLIEIGQAAKRKETQNNKFFIKTIWNTIADKMLSDNEITYEIFNEMLSEPFDIRNGNAKNDPDYIAAAQFCVFLENIYGANHYEFYNNFDDFLHIREDTMKIAITSFLGHALKKFQFINVYRDLALDIYYMRPNETINCLRNFFIESIERYQVIVNLGLNENLKNFDTLGIVIIEFYNVGLINDEILERFMKVAKSSKILIEIFIYVLVEVLTKYRGKFVQIYFDHCKKSSKEASIPEGLIPVVREYIQGSEVKAGRKSMR